MLSTSRWENRSWLKMRCKYLVFIRWSTAEQHVPLIKRRTSVLTLFHLPTEMDQLDERTWQCLSACWQDYAVERWVRLLRSLLSFAANVHDLFWQGDVCIRAPASVFGEKCLIKVTEERTGDERRTSTTASIYYAFIWHACFVRRNCFTPHFLQFSVTLFLRRKNQTSRISEEMPLSRSIFQSLRRACDRYAGDSWPSLSLASSHSPPTWNLSNHRSNRDTHHRPMRKESW